MAEKGGYFAVPKSEFGRQEFKTKMCSEVAKKVLILLSESESGRQGSPNNIYMKVAKKVTNLPSKK